MEFIGRLEKSPLKDMDGNNLIILNIGKEDRILHKIFNEYRDIDLTIDMKKYRKKRSKEANRYFWKCISVLANGLNNDNWDQYLMELERYDVNCYFGSSGYNSAEFSRLLNGVIEDIKDAGLDIPVS